MVSSENHTWEQELSQAIVRQRLKKETKIIVISTITSFNKERFQRTIDKSKQKKMLIVDEAHRFTTRPESLKGQFQYMLGLSATPFSGRNTAKGEELMAFFGGRVFNLPIEIALEKGFLVNYYYHPIFVEATEDEEEKFRKKTAQIAGCFHNGICIDPENLALHLRARLRIISMAQEKIDRIEDILKAIKEPDHFIVYCGDGRLYDDSDDEIRHIQFVMKKLSALKYKSSQFTASENMSERMQLVEAFNGGAIDALVAIRCLDEGINIPSIEGALVLSSNDDYREFVQRRGRILRTYGNKKYANIYDVIVLPSRATTKMAEIELRRYYEYARLALNKDALLQELETIATDYGLELSEFITTFDEGKEAELDD
jgi:superfamily II DNA or RNA helicase